MLVDVIAQVAARVEYMASLPEVEIILLTNTGSFVLAW